MFNKRLMQLVPESRRYIIGNVAAQWCSLMSNVILMWILTGFIYALYQGRLSQHAWTETILLTVLVLAAKYFFKVISTRMSFLSGKTVKVRLREMIYAKLLRLGSDYKSKVDTSEIVQVAVEGVNQLETYFGSYLPQFFYAMLASFSLFVVLSVVNLSSAIVLFVCVPLIPICIMVVQKWAKKLLAGYWDQYTGLGDTFLENLQGLTTLKIYKADAMKHQQMNEEAESFRRITMRVLTMQLNSIAIMDLVAYGGAALGIIMALSQFYKGHIDMRDCLLIILISADFFIPMRVLGNFFHVAMNGLAASDKIFHLIDLPEPEQPSRQMGADGTIQLSGVSYDFPSKKRALDGVDMTFPMGSFTAIVGESGCGKSTTAGILMKRYRHYTGDITIGGVPLRDISEESLFKNITYIEHQSYLFRATVRENLRVAKPDASDEEMNAVLRQVELYDFLQREQGLETVLSENGANLSGGQRQRLALARAILHDSAIYIFDEATSNIDVESENSIMQQIYLLAKHKTVILISHRLANVVGADNIYVMQQGRVMQSGTHDALLAEGGSYRTLWDAQQELEHYVKGEAL